MRKLRITALLAVVLLILGACGQSGALYNPPPAPIENSSSGNTDEIPEKTSTPMSEGA